jgi:hypothetical protein
MIHNATLLAGQSEDRESNPKKIVMVIILVQQLGPIGNPNHAFYQLAVLLSNASLCHQESNGKIV